LFGERDDGPHHGDPVFYVVLDVLSP